MDYDLKKYVLLDDDVGLTAAWELDALNYGVDLMVFNDTPSFKREIMDCDRKIHIYIDLHLGDHTSGMDILTWCKQIGFQNVYIITADKSIYGKSYDDIVKIVSKYPPFSLSREREDYMRNK